MSLSYESKENHRGFADLTRQNWTTWIAHIKDYILALDHEDAADIWQTFIWKPSDGNMDDPINHDYQRAPNAPAKKLRVHHNKAWQFIRNKLSKAMFQSTLKLDHSVPKLLRHLRRNKYNDGTVSDRSNALRKKSTNR